MKSTTPPYQGYKTGDVVLCKLKGYPAWPCKVFQTWQEAGKRGTLWWCVVFFPKGDHYWARAGEMSQLTPLMIDRFLDSGKKGKDPEMYKGYEIAKDSRKWDAKHLSGQPRTYEGPHDGRGGVKVPPQSKASSQAVKSVKRQRTTSEASSAAPPSASGSGSGRESKQRAASSTADENEEREDEEEREARRARKIEQRRLAEAERLARRSNKTVRTAASRELDTASTSAPRQTVRRTSSPPHKKKKERHTQPITAIPLAVPDVAPDADQPDEDMQWVWSMRYHFQRYLLDKPPVVGEMYMASQKLTLLEQWSITEEQIMTTKIGKVLSRIANPDKTQIPDGDRYKIASRARLLTERWQKLFVTPLASQPSAVGGAPTEVTREAAPVAAEVPKVVPVVELDVDVHDKEVEREPSVELVERAPSPEPEVLPVPTNIKGDSILVVRRGADGADEKATRIDSSDVVGCEWFSDVLSNSQVPREYEDQDREGVLLKTLIVVDFDPDAVHVFLHILMGTEGSGRIKDFASLSSALATATAFNAPSVRETAIERLLDRVHAGERVAEIFALGAAYRSNRLVQASLALFDGGRGGRRLRLQQIDKELYVLIPHSVLQEFYELEDLVVSKRRSWAQVAQQFRLLA